MCRDFQLTCWIMSFPFLWFDKELPLFKLPVRCWLVQCASSTLAWRFYRGILVLADIAIEAAFFIKL
jgi:hypothetical protein